MAKALKNCKDVLEHINSIAMHLDNMINDSRVKDRQTPEPRDCQCGKLMSLLGRVNTLKDAAYKMENTLDKEVFE